MADRFEKKDKIYIEKKEYKDRIELRIKIEGSYPPRLNRKGIYHRYLSYWVHGQRTDAYINYCFIEMKRITGLGNLIQGNFQTRLAKATNKCSNLIWDYKQSQEEPTITKLG